jgi:hypothetical protein
MPSINDFFPDKWLHAEHLQGKRPKVIIDAVNVETLFNPRTKKNEQKLVVAFRGKELRLILNKTQARSLATICKTDDYSKWHGHEVVLSTGKAPNGADTILISPVPDAGPKPTPAPEQSDLDDGTDSLDITIDPDTGEIVSADKSLWEPNAPVTSKPNRLSPAQVTRLNILGVDVHGKNWNTERPALVSEVSDGACTSCKELTPEQATVLITLLETELRRARNGKVTA